MTDVIETEIKCSELELEVLLLYVFDYHFTLSPTKCVFEIMYCVLDQRSLIGPTLESTSPSLLLLCH